MDFADIFRENNADIVSLQENIDTGTPSGRLFYNMVAVMAQWEREEIGDRVKASIAIRAKLGKPLNGKAPFGYVWKDKKLQPHPDEAPVRKLMYELFAEYKRKKTVARLLNERGYRTRDGSNFSDTSVDRLIQDPTAKGVHRANFTRRVGDNKPWALKPEHEWILTEVEPIVSIDLWQRCNDLLEARKTKQQRPSKRAVHLFAGLTFCECGTKMYVPTNSPKYICTKCRNKIPIVDLGAIFLDELKNYLLSPEKLSGYLKGANNAIGEKTRLLETLQKEHDKATQEMQRVYRLFLDEGMTAEQFKALYNPADIRKKQMEEEMPRVQAELDVQRIDGFSSEYIVSEITDIHTHWPKMSHEERRNLVEILVNKITIGKDEIDISLCYLPTFKEMTNGQRLV